MSASFRFSKIRGFEGSRGTSAAEMLIAVVVVGVLALMSVGAVRGVIPGAQNQQAVAAANAINTAQLAYANRTPGYATAWAAATSNEAKYQILASGGYLPYSKAYLNSADGSPYYAPQGYTLTLQALDANGNFQQVTITDPSSNAVAY